MQKINKKIWHIIIGGSVGNLTEWYNILLYGYLASVISQLFFPTDNPLMSLTLAFTVFALSFFVRPFGGILFGWIGDVYGRQRALVLSLIMMAVPTFLIGCLPTYQQIGVISPLLLCIFRVLQGLATGGEHTGSAIYLAEYAPAHRRAFWVSIVPTSAAIGILISSATALLIISSFTHKNLLVWGWRVGYWIGSLLCIISIFLRVSLPETPYFKKLQEEKLDKQYSMINLIKNKDNLKALMIVSCLSSAWGILYQILFIWMPTYLTQVQHISASLALQLNSAYIFLFGCLILIVGYVADYINRQWLLMTSCIAMAILAYPLFVLLSSGNFYEVCLAMGLFTFIFSIYLPAAFVSMIEIFNTGIRFTGLSLGFNIGLAIFGGTCPLVVTWLIAITHNNTSPAVYVILAALAGLLASLYMPNKRGKPI
ncbi:MAG: MFS transporter [Gammaproteobacteria bacterium]|nr:MFS transporter [Gammaproteobacteria bacterium]